MDGSVLWGIDSEVGGWAASRLRPHLPRRATQRRPSSGWVSKTIRPGEEAAGDTAEAIEL
jgi:hypothetical protein